MEQNAGESSEMKDTIKLEESKMCNSQDRPDNNCDEISEESP